MKNIFKIFLFSALFVGVVFSGIAESIMTGFRTENLDGAQLGNKKGAPKESVQAGYDTPSMDDASKGESDTSWLDNLKTLFGNGTGFISSIWKTGTTGVSHLYNIATTPHLVIPIIAAAVAVGYAKYKFFGADCDTVKKILDRWYRVFEKRNAPIYFSLKDRYYESSNSTDVNMLIINLVKEFTSYDSLKSNLSKEINRFEGLQSLFENFFSEQIENYKNKATNKDSDSEEFRIFDDLISPKSTLLNPEELARMSTSDFNKFLSNFEKDLRESLKSKIYGYAIPLSDRITQQTCTDSKGKSDHKPILLMRAYIQTIRAIAILNAFQDNVVDKLDNNYYSGITSQQFTWEDVLQDLHSRSRDDNQRPQNIQVITQGSQGSVRRRS